MRTLGLSLAVFALAGVACAPVAPPDSTTTTTTTTVVIAPQCWANSGYTPSRGDIYFDGRVNVRHNGQVRTTSSPACGGSLMSMSTHVIADSPEEARQLCIEATGQVPGPMFRTWEWGFDAPSEFWYCV